MRVVGGKLIKESPGYEYFHKATINSSSFGEIDTANLKGAKPVFSAIQSNIFPHIKNWIIL